MRTSRRSKRLISSSFRLFEVPWSVMDFAWPHSSATFLLKFSHKRPTRGVNFRLVLLFTAIVFAVLSVNGGAVSANAQGASVTGEISDQSGARVADAEVSIIAADSSLQRTRSHADGSFTLPIPAGGAGRLRVSAAGFELFELGITSPAEPIRVVLVPSPVTGQVTVSATRTETRLGDTTASVVILDRQRIEQTGAVTLDDTLRQVPGFTLFRRSGSRTANPTAQGVSLRATGASGASRAVVLEDGVPLNDPFGGWVYWNRVPREAIDRVEVLRGGASNLYGSAALGGIVNIFTSEAPTNPQLSLSISAGSQTTIDSSLFAGARFGNWGVSFSAADFGTDGYILVDPRERGVVDTPASSRNAALEFTVTGRFGAADRVFARATTFGESRHNGTPLQINRTHLRTFATGGELARESAGAFSVRLFGGTEVFDQIFTSVNAPRTAETLTRLQRSPSQHIGFSFQWSRAVGSRQAFVAGIEGRSVRGSSDEIGYTAGNPTSLIGAGGRERDVGAFAQDVIQITPRFLLTAGARFDQWRNYDAQSATRPLIANGPNSLNRFPDRTEHAFSPQLSLLYKISERFSLNASITRAFRAPSLNELYRSFRVGNVLTLANENLRAERLTGGEAGIRFDGWSGKLFFRSNLFWTEIARPVANVTLTTTPNLITRQRQNLGRTRAAGLELDGEVRLNPFWTLSGGYLFAAATVNEFPANRSLEGLWIPQVARQQITFQIRFAKASHFTASAQGRYNGRQFEDDQNLFALEPFFTLDATISRRVSDRLELFVSGENLTNQRYSVGRTPVRTIAPPLFVRAGLRLVWGK
jgi:outer membrane receptor protein involved in Fe transport